MTLLTQYHYLGYAMPFGARLQYLVYVSRPVCEVVGCIQFSSPAWRMRARDQWIGWGDAKRAAGLQQVVNNSRFLILASILESNEGNLMDLSESEVQMMSIAPRRDLMNVKLRRFSEPLKRIAQDMDLSNKAPYLHYDQYLS